MSGPTMGVSHQPPDIPPAGADRDRPASCLLGLTAFIDSRTNSTTACCDTDDTPMVSKIQITFVVADPPQVSYFRAYCIGSNFTEKPTIIHTEGNLALLYIGVAKRNYYGLDRYAFYVYHANGGSNGEPSLTILPQPSGRRIIERCQIGLLPGGIQDTSGGHVLRPHGYSHSHDYHVAALFSSSGPLHFELYLYSSKTQTWTVKKPVLNLNEQEAEEFSHTTSGVITVGGEYGTMGFVDHSRGILFCNVLQGDCPDLYYVPLPTPLPHSRLDSRRACDIAVDAKGDRIRIATSFLPGCSPATYLSSCPGSCAGVTGGPPPPTTGDLKRMYTEYPTLSLHDNTLYVMISCNIGAWDRWVIAVDMANMTLQDVAHYRRENARLKFRHSKISNHLNMGASPGAKGYMKRPGMEVLESSRKKQFVLSMVDDMVSSWVGEQEQHQDAGTIKGASGDYMDLDMPTLLKEH
uniref:Uncharacterized protein n=1 Tax=Avena sativa TaxID=4498 RepID=A0ACD6AFM3_AVESA